MKYTTMSLVAAVMLFVTLLRTPSVLADTVYTYTGNTLSLAYGSPVCGSSCGINGEFTVATALGDNLSSVNVTPESFSFSDGATTYSNGAGDSISISLSTGATGKITQWTIFVTPPGGPSVSSIGTGNALAGIEDTSFEPSYYLYNSADPGTWAVANTTGVPELRPSSSTSALLLIACAVFVIRGRRPVSVS